MNGLAPRLVLPAVGALGVSAVLTQLALLRELLGTFAGNELVLGIVLGTWLWLTGLGAWSGRTAAGVRRPERGLILLLVLVAFLPLAQVLAVRALRNAVFIRGAMVGLTGTAAACLVVLFPFCVVSGYLLTLACVPAGAQTRITLAQLGTRKAPDFTGLMNNW